MNWLKSYKSSKLLLWKVILQKSSSTAATRFFQLPTYPTTGEIPQQLLPTIRLQCSAFVEIEYFFPSQETMYNYNKSGLSPYDPTKLAIHSILRPEDDLISNFGSNFKKTVSSDDVVHFSDEENIVTYVDFDLGITFLPETPTKMRQIHPERNYFCGSCEKPQCIPSNDQHECPVDEQHSSNNFLTSYILWDMSPGALTSLNYNNDRYSISNQYPQPTTHQPKTDSYPECSSLRTMNSRRKGLRVSFAFCQRNYLPDGRVNQTVATVKDLSDLSKPGAMDGVAPFVMNCTCI